MSEINKKEIELVINTKNKDAPSVSYYYGEKIKKDENIAVKVEGGVIYRWDNFFWNARCMEWEERTAREWLDEIAPSKSNSNQGKELAKTAVQKACELPKRDPSKVCIPCKNAYLHLEQEYFPPTEVEDDNGNIVTVDGGTSHAFIVGKPDKKEGITYGLSCEVKGVKEGEHYMPKANLEGTLFGQFLETSQPDPVTRALLQEYVGYTLLPDTRFSIALFCYGEGENGKGAFSETIAALHKKVAAMDIDNLDGFQMEDAIDSSLIIVDEAPEKFSAKSSNKWKSIVDGKKIKVDRKFSQVVTTSIQAKWIICSNHFLKTTDSSWGLWRRILAVPWNTKIPENKKIFQIEKKIIANELNYVLDWALEGLLRLLDRGKFPDEPEAVKELKEEIRAATDSVRGWLKDTQPVVKEGASTVKSNIYKDYERWAEDSGHKGAVAENKFWSRLKEALPGLVVGTRSERVNGKQKTYQVANLVVEGLLDMNGNYEF